MPTIKHEVIIDDIRDIVHELRSDWPDVVVAIEDLASIYLGHYFVKGGRPIPDLLIVLKDEAGPIAVEVGIMPDGKWSNYLAKDGEAIRVLRVGFDRSVSMIRQRFTEAEIALIRLLSKRLKEMAIE